MRLSAGAGFVVVLCAAIVTMPGLPKEPQAWHVDDGRRKVIGIKYGLPPGRSNMETPAAGPSAPDYLLQRRATLGDVVSRHRFWIGGAVNLLGGGFIGVAFGGGLTVLELMGELKQPLFGVPLGLAFFGCGLWFFWQLRDDVGMRVEQRLLGLVFVRAGDERVIPWRDIAKVGWLQEGSLGKVHLAEVHLDLYDGSRVKLPVERLSDRRTLTAALSAKLGVQFPPH